MVNKLTDKKSIRMLSILGWLVYFSSYITRLNFGAVLVEFLQAEGITKTAAAPITTALFITYGAGQLLSGYLGDRISPRLLIFGGLLVASVKYHNAFCIACNSNNDYRLGYKRHCSGNDVAASCEDLL